jgi:hypothetical protein
MSWLQSIEVRGALAVAVLSAGVLLTPFAHAQDAPATDMPAAEAPQQGMSGGCEAFKWPLDKERAAFESAGLEQIATGTAGRPWKEQAFALALVPATSVAYTVPPGGKAKAEGTPQYGGVLPFGAPEKAGVYQVTLSGEGWIDLVQNGAALKSAGHSGAKNCPGLRKSVRFEVGAAPVALQISGSPAESIRIAIRPAE